MVTIKVDVVVIGTGPGGEGAAMQATKGGKRVVVCERFHRIGGGCTHWGTIPSKALRSSIFHLTEAMRNPIMMRAGFQPKPSLNDLRQSAEVVINQQEAMRADFYRRNDVQVVSGHAKFVSTNEIQVGKDTRIQADHFVLAVGTRPYRPPEIDFSHPRIFDSDTILNLQTNPRSMTIYGAGVVGCEYASMFRNLETKINLVNTRARLLEFLDDEITDALSYFLRERGVLIRHLEKIDRVEPRDDSVIVFLHSGKALQTEILFWAAGRTGNTEDLGLEILDVETDSRGCIPTNEFFQTKAKHVYAVGDVSGFPSLASAAYTQGRAAADHILGRPGAAPRSIDYPSGIYTIPEISSIGKTERELTEARVPYEVGHSQFKSLARAQISGRTVGMLKILFHRETLEILGVHCFGDQAAEIIHIGQAIMSQPGTNNSLNYFIDTTFNYPTMAEAYRVAALNGYNRLFSG
ncbi:MAG TPA: Si-specific NAD(P)(+) transhydrogenase [Pirellulaceae bacterium]|nr:Si-specific NAD(P)(+) transhydrogenase [Pirellulaceae bacterium]HMO91479.1 Si-specific NAD(P)(+) transhydrogenase [Pirellulaceae bacterium]HMP70992.1 Si-specific NAD(P)(+) transhydrogenase [Pirellulaceae bacterium]